MEKAEREQALRYLTANRDLLRGIAAGLSAEQRSFKPAAGRWSIADCIEHSTVVETGVLKGIQRALEGPPPADRPSTQGKDQVILEQVPLRTAPIQGPERLMPTGRWPDAEELLRAFEAAREQTLRFAAETEADLRAYSFPHPVLGPLDCYQWLLAIAAHCERHVHQMEEIMADPAFSGKAGSAQA